MKKLIIAAASVLSLTLMAGFATFALLNTKGKAQNTFTYGNVKISLEEKYENPEKVIMPGTVLSKTVSVKNEGNKDCYVRIKFDDKFENQKELEKEGRQFDYSLSLNGWTQGSEDYIYYNKILKPGETTENLPVDVEFSYNLSEKTISKKFLSNTKAFAVQSDNNPIPDGKDVTQVAGWPAD